MKAFVIRWLLAGDDRYEYDFHLFHHKENAERYAERILMDQDEDYNRYDMLSSLDLEENMLTVEESVWLSNFEHKMRSSEPYLGYDIQEKLIEYMDE